MVENMSTSTQTKHMDVCYHFVREFIEDGFINKADIFTKNVVGDLYNKHTNDMVWEAKDLD